MGGAREQIELQVTHLSYSRRRRRALTTPDDRVQPREKFVKGKRLREIIIAARVQPAYPIVDLAQRAQDQNGSPAGLGAKRFEHRQTVHDRQIAIQNDRIIVLGQACGQAVKTRHCDIASMAKLGQSLADVARSLPVIFDEQYLQFDASL